MSAGRWIWPATELGPALATFSGRDAADAGDNPLALAVAHGFDPVPVDWAGPPNAALVRAVAPGWCRTPEGAWLLLARHRLGRVQVVTPQGRRWTGAAAAAGWLVPVRPAWADAIAQAPEVRHSRRLRAADALTPEVPVIEASCVRLNSAPTDPVRRHLRAEGVTGRLALAVLAIVAIARGEAPPGTDPAEVIRQLSAPLYYQFLTDTRALTVADAARSVAVTMAAVEAGVFAEG